MKRRANATDDATPASPAQLVTADFTPPAVRSQRRAAGAKLISAAVIAATVAAVGGGYLWLNHTDTLAENENAAANATHTQLVETLDTLTDVQHVQNEIGDVTEQLGRVTAGNIQAADVLAAIVDATPDGVAITRMQAQNYAAGGSNAIPSALEQFQNLDPNDGRQIGSVTITGSAPDNSGLANYVSALQNVPGLSSPYPTNTGINPISGHSTFTLRVFITGTFLTHPDAANTTNTPTDGNGTDHE